ncbi:MAG: glycoside hydrolase family 16 protein [Oscillospiraceae bacterium]|nr:glycoside hydrolase family 16 protein [Oscillospiraceae bacterium]
MLSHRNQTVLRRIFKLPGSRIVASASGFKKITVFFVVLFQLFGALLFDLPTTPDGPDLDMSKFTLVWQDEFDAGSLDKNMWSGHYIWQADDYGYQRDTSWWDMDHVKVEDGSLIITADYRDTGPSATGYYASAIDTHPGNGQYYGGEGYEQLYGYFEIRCKFPAGDGFNPAFWLLCEGMFLGETSGVNGCEIDIFETKTNPSGSTKRWKDSVYHTIHVGSYGDNHRQEVQGHFCVGNPTEQFNTYGFEWNENEYIWYINGVESARTSFAGVCRVPMYLIISLGVDDYVNKEQLPAQFVIDYVRAYQYTELL